MCWTRLGNSYSKCKASIKQMAATFQVFMQYKIFESYCVFNGQYHEYIKNVQNLKKNRKSNTVYTKASEILASFI